MSKKENGNSADYLREAGDHIKQSAKKAEKIAKEPGKLKKLLQDAGEKLAEFDTENKTFSTLLNQLSVFLRMVRAYANKEYPELPWRSLVSIVAAILYFIMPFDLIPDYIPIAGFMDDMAVLAWVYRNVEKDVDEFLNWEAETGHTRDA